MINIIYEDNHLLVVEKPINIPVPIPDIDNIGKYKNILKFLNIIDAANNWPTLWNTAAEVLTPITDTYLLSNCFTNIVTIKLNTPPEMLYSRDEILPPRIEDKSILSINIIKESL